MLYTLIGKFVGLVGLLIMLTAGVLIRRWYQRRGELMPEDIKGTRLAPEIITPAKGACGISGCPNKRPHSHVEDLVRRMKEK